MYSMSITDITLEMIELLTLAELRSTTLPELETHLSAVEEEIAQLETQDPLVGHWVDSAGGGRYHRLRWNRGRAPDGEELPYGSQTLAADEVASMRVRCAAGKRLRGLGKHRSRIVEELERKRSMARKLGLL